MDIYHGQATSNIFQDFVRRFTSSLLVPEIIRFIPNPPALTKTWNVPFSVRFWPFSKIQSAHISECAWSFQRSNKKVISRNLVVPRFFEKNVAELVRFLLSGWWQLIHLQLHEILWWWRGHPRSQPARAPAFSVLPRPRMNLIFFGTWN